MVQHQGPVGFVGFLLYIRGIRIYIRSRKSRRIWLFSCRPAMERQKL
ncbi:hypothetical protein SF83666_c00230 [Sinorhizobium fredii CCBAU 83666]|nr:hypothetical protein SF83666_c00230 [Sinorhizobium fredii CCBAU 83666]